MCVTGTQSCVRGRARSLPGHARVKRHLNYQPKGPFLLDATRFSTFFNPAARNTNLRIRIYSCERLRLFCRSLFIAYTYMCMFDVWLIRISYYTVYSYYVYTETFIKIFVAIIIAIVNFITFSKNID